MEPRGSEGRAAETARVKYLFMDIVGFTIGRTVEAQTDIVAALNRIAREAIETQGIPLETTVVLPTGDGLCIGVVEFATPFDVHLLLALDIQARVERYNAATLDKPRQFSVRIGLNENVDNLVLDFNGKRNLAGAGISWAQRVMDQGDGGQILLSESVFETLRYREKYTDAFKGFDAKTKHGLGFKVHQYVKPAEGMNVAPPRLFTPTEARPRQMTRLVAYYLASAIKNEEAIKRAARTTGTYEYTCVVLLYMLAHDCEERAATFEYEQAHQRTWGAGSKDFADQFAHYEASDYWVVIEAYDAITYDHLRAVSAYDCFLSTPLGRNFVFVSPEGRERLKAEWPAVWEQFFGGESPEESGLKEGRGRARAKNQPDPVSTEKAL